MAGDELVRGVAVAVLTPPLGRHESFVRFQYREPPDFFQIPGDRLRPTKSAVELGPP
jgi:hypothetical protein